MKEAPNERLECPKCGCRHFETTHVTGKKGTIRRRRTCRHCGRALHTREIPESLFKQLSQPGNLYSQLTDPPKPN